VYRAFYIYTKNCVHGTSSLLRRIINNYLKRCQTTTSFDKPINILAIFRQGISVKFYVSENESLVLTDIVNDVGRQFASGRKNDTKTVAYNFMLLTSRKTSMKFCSHGKFSCEALFCDELKVVIMHVIIAESRTHLFHYC
jgi:hypothetical protein